MSRRALLLINQKARQGRTDLSAIRSRLLDAGIQIIEAPRHRPSGTTRMIRELGPQVDEVIVGGGDGSLNIAAEGLVETGKRLGILPLGTANDLCRTLGIPLDVTSACDVICEGKTRRIDLGSVNGKFFFNVASLGLTTKVTQRLTRESKSRWGVFAYALAAIGAFVRSRPVPMELRSDGKTRRVRTIQITVGNGRHYGGGMTVDQETRIDDGLLEFFSLELRHWWQMLCLLPKMRSGNLAGTAHVRFMRGTQFEVRSLRRRRRWIVTDGEFATRTPAIFKVVPDALSVYAPE